MRTGSRKSRQSDDPRDVVLFAVLGMSPAVLTETAWKLAQEMPKIVPSRVVVLTTTEGERQVREKLLSPCVDFKGETAWGALRKAVRASGSLLPEPEICLFKKRGATTRDLADIVTPEDNLIVADTLLEELRKFTENPDCRIVASLAGGRKTMGALLYACMTLIGRECDRITHVLVQPPYDQPGQKPPFIFPDKKERGKSLITLADIPFVPLRNRFADISEMPGSFSRLVGKYSRALQQGPKPKYHVIMHADRNAVSVDGREVSLRPRAFLTLRFLMELNQRQAVPSGQIEALDPLRLFLQKESGLCARKWQKNVDQDDLKRELSYLRTTLKIAGISWGPGSRGASLSLPPHTTSGC